MEHNTTVAQEGPLETQTKSENERINSKIKLTSNTWSANTGSSILNLNFSKDSNKLWTFAVLSELHCVNWLAVADYLRCKEKNELLIERHLFSAMYLVVNRAQYGSRPHPHPQATLQNKINRQTKQRNPPNYYYTCFHPNKWWMWCFDSKGIYVSPKGALAQKPLTKTQPTDQYCTHLLGCNYNPNPIPMTPHTTRLVWRQARGRIQGSLIVLGMEKRDRNMRRELMAWEKKNPSTTSELNRNLLTI